MPSPIAHILGGSAIYLAGARTDFRSKAPLVVTLFGSILPDLDFLPGILTGHPAAFHHGVSHSLTFAILYGAVVFFFFQRVGPNRIAIQSAILAALAYASHLVLDLVSVNEGARGIPILWPLADRRFGLMLGVFGHFHHSGFNRGIWSVLRWDNLPAVARELMVMGTLVLLLRFWRDCRDRGNPR